MRKSTWAMGYLCVVASPATAREPTVIDYVIPAAKITAGVTQRITRCPPSAETQAAMPKGTTLPGPGFHYAVLIAGKSTPGRLVHFNTESGFLVDRETKAHFADDWYLKDFNGKTTGQGGPLLVSLIKAGAAAVAMAANPVAGAGVAAAAVGSGRRAAQYRGAKSVPPKHYFAKRWYLECLPDVIEALATLKEQREDVAKLETLVMGGDTSAATQELLTLRRKQVDEAEAGLSVKATVKGGLTPAVNAHGVITNLTGQMDPPKIARWFQAKLAKTEVKAETYANTEADQSVEDLLRRHDRKVPGLYGYQVSVVPNAQFQAWFGCKADAPGMAGCAESSSVEPLPTRDLVYLRPVPATVSVWPNPAKCAAVCPADENWAEGNDASDSIDVKLPQLSRLYTMRTGASIFGGRTVGAEFGPMGEPTMLEYDVGSSGKDVAGVIDAGVGAAQTVRDAPGAATKRKLDQLTNSKALQDLMDEMEKDAK
ncbi:hypothetical protein [Sphingomonas antarctica]|uniref:hypothetical protein n=1 Tax=Sphingomonas antarctica TaxID=2040274 RepID=UPI0039E8C0B9